MQGTQHTQEYNMHLCNYVLTSRVNGEQFVPGLSSHQLVLNGDVDPEAGNVRPPYKIIKSCRSCGTKEPCYIFHYGMSLIWRRESFSKVHSRLTRK